ncbi:MAG: hypothetical protein LBV43_10570 [Prevotella sp.]|jgi:hypothetical protein|nr:hypothetical protein [Prevotella sp.]
MNKKSFLYLICFYFVIVTCTCCESTDNKKQVFNLKDFGAIPDDGQDDSEAFNKAMDKCRENPGSILIIPSGSYNYKNDKAMEFEYKAINGQYGENVQGHFFKPDGEYIIALDMNGFKNISIQAEGVTLIQEGWYEAVSITNAQNIKIKGLKLIHKRPPFTTGEIVESTPDYFDMKIDTLKYSYLTDAITGRVHYYDANSQRIYTGGSVEKKELMGNRQTIRIYTKTQPKVGDFCILRHSAHNRAGILIKESSNIELEDVTIHSQPGMGVIGHRSENISMKNLQIIPAVGTFTSTNTDATHFTSCKGKILFDVCKFGGQGDDCTNVHNYYWSVYKESGNDVRVTVENADLHALSLDYPDVGDTLALISKDNLNIIDSYIAKKISTSIKDWKVVVTLDKPVDYDVNDYYMINMTRCPAVDIFNNTVRSHMARAYLIKTKNVHIKGNVIQNSSGTAIQLGAEASWREGFPVENVLIENNWFINCGYGHGRQRGTAINVEVNGVRTKAEKLNKNIVIKNNTIQAVGETAIYISDSDGVQIMNNEIQGAKKAVQVNNSENIEIQDNGILAIEYLK